MFRNKIRNYHFNKLENHKNDPHKNKILNCFPKAFTKPVIKDKILSDSEKLFPKKYSKDNVKYDDFAKIFHHNRPLISHSINNSFYYSIKGKQKMKNSFSSPEKTKYKEGGVNKSTNLLIMDGTDSDEEIIHKINKINVKRKKCKVPKLLQNSPSIKKIKKYIQMTKQYNGNLVINENSLVIT